MEDKNASKDFVITYSVLCVILCVIIVSSMLGEKVAYNDGAGWDGLFYREVAYNFTNAIFNHEYDLYHIQRVLPFSIINITYNVFHIEKNNASLMWGVQLLNFIVIALGVWFLIKISKKLNFSIPSIIVIFSALFFNYPVLKLTGYYPFLTDVYGFVFAIIQFYSFIEKKNILLGIVSLLGAFIWPTLFLCGLLLIFLPRKPLELSCPALQVDKVLLKSVKIICTISIPALFMAVAIHEEIRGRHIIDYPWLGLSLNVCFVVLALIVIPFYVWKLIKPINIPIVSMAKNFVSSVKVKNILLLLILAFLMRSVQYYFSDTSNPFPLVAMLFQRLLIPAVQAPLAFMVSHFMYYGFIIIFLCIFWEDVVKEYARYGYSFFIIIVLGLIMFCNTESRHLLTFVPFLFFPLVETLKKIFTVKSAIVFSIASLFLSRFWFKINGKGIEEAFVFVSNNDYTHFPAQRYFMSQGPWMSYSMYLVFSCFFIVSFIVIYLWIKKTNRFPVAN